MVPRAIHNPGQFAFCHSALRMRQDRGLCEKALFRYNTEGHFKTCSYQCAAYTNNKEVLQHHRKKPINHASNSGKYFINPVEIALIDFRSLACQCKEKTHTWLLHVFDHFSKYLWMIFSHRQTKSSSDC